MPITIAWQDDEEEPTIDIDLFVRVDRRDARHLRGWLNETGHKQEADHITEYLQSIADWQMKTRKEVK